MDHREENYSTLLNQLKITVENLLSRNPDNLWEVHESLHRLHIAIVDIFKHGFRFFKDNGEPDLWVFIQGLSWLQPALAASPSFLGIGTHASPIRSPIRTTDKAITWLYRSIENYTLSEKLSWLLSDHEHLLSCYKSTAYLRQVQYSEATLICLKAVEQRQFSLLAKIDSTLYTRKKSNHRRSLSYPEPKLDDASWSVKKPLVAVKESVEQLPQPVDQVDAPHEHVQAPSLKLPNEKFINSAFKATEDEKNTKHFIRQNLLKKYFSSSDLYLMHYKEKYRISFLKNVTRVSRMRRNSFSQSSFSEENTSNDKELLSDLLKVRYDKPEKNLTKEKSHSLPITLRRNSDTSNNSSYTNLLETNSESTPKHKRRRRSSFFKLPFRIWEESDDESPSMCSEDTKTLVNPSPKLTRRKSFIENGGNITLPLCVGSFTKPSPGQSIMSFLSSGVFTNTYAELDRENAHFHVSEALIAALEQAKFNQQLNVVADEMLEESDEEINQLKRIIRIRRRQKQKEKHFVHARNIVSPETTDATITTDQSVNSLSSSVYSTSESISTDFEDEENAKENSPLNKCSGLSVSKSSVFSDSSKIGNNDPSLSLSAENVAISLLRRFKDNQLPAASEIEWLVSEGDAPQKILPLPNHLLIGDDGDEQSLDKSTLLRGTSEWAPPRPQIIFTPHPAPIRKQMMEKQCYRCAGCGTKVAQKYASKFRYCEYLGRYFCTSCHTEQMAVIPGKVLSKWDFNKYTVSNFSFDLLDQMFTDPLFNIMDLNQMLYHRARDLQKVRLLRVSLFYIKDFIFSCKYGQRSQEMLKSVPSHIYNDPDNYSLKDLIDVKSNKLKKILLDISKTCENHVSQCELCHARGFMCEICSKQEIIFPWQINAVVRCIKCGSCHHIRCYNQKKICPKCVRINNRNDFNRNDNLNERVS
ncbi:run domain Beclin-1-interacting and cysteine-rich domain-containing protein-like isoform X2 [Planococcus citri]